MPEKSEKLQPGRALHDAISAAFRNRGESLTSWCTKKGLLHSNLRQAAFGMWIGPKGVKALNEAIDATDRETVELLYAQRMKSETEQLETEVA